MVLVSIIIPTYNRSHFLLETLESVKFQNHKNWECIVVDDGSTDDTEKIVNNYISKDERFKYVKRPAHLPKGACACRNYGFSLAQGDYIQWFDDDDIMFDNYLSDRIRLFSKNINFVIGTGFYADKSLMNRSMIPIKWEDNLFKSLATWRSHILTPQ
jgi:glycosyltransferase involved in cell wall biosynthesis